MKPVLNTYVKYILVLIVSIGIAWLYNNTPNRTIANWDGTFVFKPTYYHQPHSKQELIDLVKSVASRGGRLKVIGANHSWGGIQSLPVKTLPSNKTETHLVNLDHLNQILNLNITSSNRAEQVTVGTVTVEAGIRLKHLIGFLSEKNLTLRQMGSITEQSIAGVVSTGTHGSSYHTKILSGMVVSMELLLANGTLLKLSENQNKDIFKAALVSMGSLGVITTIELEVVPAFYLHMIEQPVTIAQLRNDSIIKLIEQSPYSKVWWFPHTSYVQVYSHTVLPFDQSLWTPIQRAMYHKSKLQVFMEAIENEITKFHALKLILWFTSKFPHLIPKIHPFLQSVAWIYKERVDVNYRLLPILHGIPVHHEMEFSIPLKYWREALETLKELENEAFLDFIFELRWTKADDIWMSPSYGRDSCLITICMYGSHYETVFMKSQERLKQLMDNLRVKHGSRYSKEEADLLFSIRPHWGKSNYLNSTDLKRYIPKFNEFLKLREEFDPTNVFMNDILYRYFYN
jgi:L-gulonolactone oxidase